MKTATDIFHLSLDGARNMYSCELCEESIEIPIANDQRLVNRTRYKQKPETKRGEEIKEFQERHLIKHGLKKLPKSKQRGRY